MSQPAPAARGTLQFVDIETARKARGLRLVLITGLPSPWSDGARGLFAEKGIDALAVRLRPGDPAFTAWTGVPNAPVALFDDEPPRSGWAEIIALAERLRPTPALVPADAETRVRMFGLLHELLGEGGLAWSRRLLLLHESLGEEQFGPRRGFPPDLARPLAARYGYTPEGVSGARRRLIEGLALFGAALDSRSAARSPYLLNGGLTALDLYLAAATAVLVPPADDIRPIISALRPALEFLDPEVAAAVPPALLAHRDFIYVNHLRTAPATMATPG